MKRFKKRVLPGLVLAIKISQDQYAIAQVVYSSEVFKDVVLIRVFRAVEFISEMGQAELDRFVSEYPIGHLYTAASCIGDPWPIIGRTLVPMNDRDHSLRTVGGEVWRGDEFVRDATKEDFRTMPDMTVEGCGGAVEAIKQILKKGTSKPHLAEPRAGVQQKHGNSGIMPSKSISVSLKRLLDDLDKISATYPEVEDTDVREQLFAVIEMGFLNFSRDYVLPVDFGMLSEVGNRAVHSAMKRFFNEPDVVLARETSSGPDERLLLFQDPAIKSEIGNSIDEYFGYA